MINDIWRDYDNVRSQRLKQNNNNNNNECKHVIDEYATCTQCGHVLNNTLISMETEWKTYDKDMSRQRCTKLNSVFSSTLSTGMGYGGYKRRRLKMHHKWVSGMDQRERSQLRVFELIDVIGRRYSLTQVVIKEAQYYYKMINDNRISKCDSMKGLPATCVYYACKQNHCARTPKEISSMFCVDIGVFLTAKKRFREVLCDIKSISKPCDDGIDVEIFLARFCHLLGISYDILNVIKSVISNARLLGCVDNKRPISLVSGVIYYVVREFHFDISKESISNICGVSPATVYLTSHELEKYSDLLIGTCIKFD